VVLQTAPPSVVPSSPLPQAGEEESPRSPDVLAPLIKKQIALGYQAGESNFKAAGALLLEAKKSIRSTKKFGRYIKALGVTPDQSGDWMRLARSERQGLSHRTIREARRDRRTRGQGRPEWPAPLDDQPDSVRERSHTPKREPEPEPDHEVRAEPDLERKSKAERVLEAYRWSPAYQEAESCRDEMTEIVEAGYRARVRAIKRDAQNRGLSEHDVLEELERSKKAISELRDLVGRWSGVPPRLVQALDRDLARAREEDEKGEGDVKASAHTDPVGAFE
jgi:hypothetical protein